MKNCIFHDVGAGNFDRVIFEIAESAYYRDEKALIFAPSEERATEIDRILWILKQEAFIPHKIFKMGEDADPTLKIAIVTAEINPIDAGMLIADGACSLEFAGGFRTIHEFVRRSSPQLHEASRRRYRNYRSMPIAVEYVNK